MQGKEFENLKSSKAPAAWVPWLWLTGAIFWAACLIIHNIFDDNGRAALTRPVLSDSQSFTSQASNRA